MEKAIEAYFESLVSERVMDDDGSVVCDKKGQPVFRPARPPTVAGLTRALGFRSKQTLYNYRRDEKYSDILDGAILRIEEYTEERLFDKDGCNGAKFSLANNFGWNEKKEKESGDDNRGVVILADVKGD